mmetsp:Transcript_1200/g.4077  ORF Transcript_1200/g.4077 Transcript_1200/m.4077 type:complete len:207 (-) Transcript_1200:244-864(-)
MKRVRARRARRSNAQVQGLLRRRLHGARGALDAPRAAWDGLHARAKDGVAATQQHRGVRVGRVLARHRAGEDGVERELRGHVQGHVEVAHVAEVPATGGQEPRRLAKGRHGARARPNRRLEVRRGGELPKLGRGLDEEPRNALDVTGGAEVRVGRRVEAARPQEGPHELLRLARVRAVEPRHGILRELHRQRMLPCVGRAQQRHET